MDTAVLPPGFLGTRADVLIDIVTLSFIVVVPALVYSWRLARVSRDYRRHRNTQLVLGITLAIVVAIFEYDLKVSGGIFELTKGSAYEGTVLLNASVYVHTIFAVLTSVIWVGLIGVSLVRFPNPPRPGPFSRVHRFWGRLGIVTMALAGLTSLPLYYFGFVA